MQCATQGKFNSITIVKQIKYLIARKQYFQMRLSVRCMEKPTVIYIISDRRSGSTLLENILSKSSEVTSVGELAMLKGHILKQGPGERWNWNCSCGNSVMECVFWRSVLKDTYEKDPS